MFKFVLLMLIGFLLLIKGADFLVKGASNIAKKFKIPEIVIGLTIVSIGTSMPELFISITSALEGHSDMSVGNVIGSNIANLLLILGLTAIIKPIKFKKSTIKYEIPICVITTIMLFVFGNTNKTISKIESIALLIYFGFFIIYTVALAKNNKVKEKKSKPKYNTLISLIFIILGVLGLKFGGDLTVNNAIQIAKILNISEKIIGITILAIGTSLPELVTSIISAKKGSTDLAIGNIIGSNILNILLIIGVSSFIKPINYNVSYNLDLIILTFSLILLFVFAFTKPKEKMSRGNGIIYFICYLLYLLMLFLI